MQGSVVSVLFFLDKIGVKCLKGIISLKSMTTFSDLYTSVYWLLAAK